MATLEYFTIEELLQKKAILEMQDGNHGEQHPSQSDFVDKGIPFLTATHVFDNQVFLNLAPRISPDKAKKLRIGWIQPNDVLLSHNATVGRVGVVPQFDGKAVIGTSLTYYRLNPKWFNSDFFALILNSQEFQSQLEQLMKQTTRNQVPITRQRELIVPVLPISEQKRIATIAQKADRLRRTRRYALQLSDTYLRSVFLEMFGDARTNPNNFPTEPLGDSLEKFESGVNFNPVSEREPASQWRVLKVSAVTSGVFEPYESKPIKPDVTFNDTLVVKKGDLLMSRANTRELVGAICMVREQPPKVLLPDKLWRVKFSKHSKLEPNYVLYALRQPKLRKIIADMASGTSGSMKNISKEQAATLPILIPPFALQEKFAQIVQKFERLRTQQREADRQAEHLFQTLLHRAFRGELTSQNTDGEPESVLLEEIRAQQAKAEAKAKTATQAMGNAADYLGTKAKQQDIEPIQLKFPGFE
ncbi:restriction endonuclease subunit S [Microcoleus sp. Pol11C2]|uniref:restriction endonuclease subunit S n=1 Tax=Microcoleus sp. Pol11C2 TaxID=3055389 RepID=UPI002FD40D2F